MGHVRDLPRKAAEIPAKYKGEKWARIAVNVDEGFEPLYIIAPEKRATILVAQNASSSSMWSKAGFGYSGFQRSGSKNSDSIRPISG